MVLEYTLYGEPRPMARARITKNGSFTPAPIRALKARHHEAAELARPDGWPMDAHYEAHISVYLGTARRPDVDNLAKLVMDALHGAAYENDSQIVRLDVRRSVDRDEPRTEVRVEVRGAA